MNIYNVQREADRATALVPLVVDIVTTSAVWVDMMADFATGFGLYIFLTEGSKFIKHVILVDSSATVLRFTILTSLFDHHSTHPSSNKPTLRESVSPPFFSCAATLQQAQKISSSEDFWIKKFKTICRPRAGNEVRQTQRGLSDHFLVPAKTGLNWFKLYSAASSGCAGNHSYKRISYPAHIYTEKSTYRLKNQTKLKSILIDLIWLKVVVLLLNFFV